MKDKIERWGFGDKLTTLAPILLLAVLNMIIALVPNQKAFQWYGVHPFFALLSLGFFYMYIELSLDKYGDVWEGYRKSAQGDRYHG